MKYLFLILCISVLISYFIVRSSALAQTMENGLYEIQEGDVSSFSFDSLISNPTVYTSPSKPGEFSGENYTVRAGNNYDPNNTPLTFSVSNMKVDFGSLSPTNPVSRISNLRVTNNSSYSYKVIASENNQLTEVKTGAKIPDTTCDDGKCNQNQAGKWDSTLSYGFGYRCEGDELACIYGDESFDAPNFYKQFPDSSLDESASTILSQGSGTGQQVTVTYKMNISSSQPQGFYLNTVTYLLIPSY